MITGNTEEALFEWRMEKHKKPFIECIIKLRILYFFILRLCTLVGWDPTLATTRPSLFSRSQRQTISLTLQIFDFSKIELWTRSLSLPELHETTGSASLHAILQQ